MECEIYNEISDIINKVELEDTIVDWFEVIENTK